MNETISIKLARLPDSPGVYIMKNRAGDIIYIGKAKVLKNRVRSYFHSPHGHNQKTQALVSNIEDFEYIVTSSEMEALLLENTLIKQHKPFYNILLKDNNGYPYLRLDLSNPYPYLEVARKLKHDKALYFGPYLGAGMARDIQELVNDLFPLRTCKHDLVARKGKIRPCMKYHIGKCLAPCKEDVSEKDYRKVVDEAVALLKGDYHNIIEALRQKMEKASEQWDFERAAQYRDRLAQVEKIAEGQKVVLNNKAEMDIIEACLDQGYAVIVIMHVRSGRLIGTKRLEYNQVNYESKDELLTQFIMQNYSNGQLVPKEIITETKLEAAKALEDILSSLRGSKVSVSAPVRGDRHALAKMAKANAEETLAKSINRELHQRQRREAGLLQLQQVLGLSGKPERIECFDISHIQGTDTVASMVVLTNGTPDNKEYRRFKIKTVIGNDDYASMEEVITRRYRHMTADQNNGEKGFSKRPDLVVVDGGKGQLNVACKVFEQLGISIPLISLAKSEEEIFVPGQEESILLGTDSPAVQLLQTIRDEAHRFAITYHRSLRNKRGLLSQLNNIHGIGEKRRKALFKEFGTVDRIKEATVEQLAAVDGMNAPCAQEVYKYFHKE